MPSYARFLYLHTLRIGDGLRTSRWCKHGDGMVLPQSKNTSLPCKRSGAAQASIASDHAQMAGADDSPASQDTAIILYYTYSGICSL